MYPVSPTKFDQYFFEEEWFVRDYFHSKDGWKEFPDHHCKVTFVESEKYITTTRNAVDIGCRDGEYTRYLQHHYNHVYCFDIRYRKLFPHNVSESKTTHFNCALGNTENKYPRKEPFIKDAITYPLDSFGLKDIDYIKIDTDGYEYDIIQGALNTIDTYSPLLVVECQENATLERFQNQQKAIDFLVDNMYYNIKSRVKNDLILTRGT